MTTSPILLGSAMGGTPGSSSVGSSQITDGSVAGVDLAPGAGSLARTAVKTSAYTAAAGDLVPVDTTSGAVTITLPSAPANKTLVAVKHVIQGATNAVTIACGGSDVFNKTSGGTPGTLSQLNQAMLLEYSSSGGIWTVLADDLPLSVLDARFAPISLTVEDVTAATYTFVLADASRVKRFDRATAQTATVPPNSSVAFPIGTVIEIAQVNAGTLTVAAGAGVTVNSPGGVLALGTQWSAARLIKTATDRWLLEPLQSGTSTAAKSLDLTRTAVKTGAYTAAAGDLVPVDTTSGAVTVTLPSAPADKSIVAVKHVTQGSTNAVTIACGGSDVFNKTGGATSGTLSQLNQAMLLEYSASGGIWTVLADDLPLTALDGRYAKVAAEQHSDLSVVNSTTETTLATLAIPTTVKAGDTLVVELMGDLLNNTGGTVSLLPKLKIGSTAVITPVATNVGTASARRVWNARFVIAIESTSAQRVSAFLDVSSPLSAGVTFPSSSFGFRGYGTSAEDTTSAKNVVFTMTLGTASANADFVCHAATLNHFPK